MSDETRRLEELHQELIEHMQREVAHVLDGICAIRKELGDHEVAITAYMADALRDLQAEIRRLDAHHRDHTSTESPMWWPGALIQLRQMVRDVLDGVTTEYGGQLLQELRWAVEDIRDQLGEPPTIRQVLRSVWRRVATSAIARCADSSTKEEE
jgi:hypothetical protein